MDHFGPLPIDKSRCLDNSQDGSLLNGTQMRKELVVGDIINALTVRVFSRLPGNQARVRASQRLAVLRPLVRLLDGESELLTSAAADPVQVASALSTLLEWPPGHIQARLCPWKDAANLPHELGGYLLVMAHVALVEVERVQQALGEEATQELHAFVQEAIRPSLSRFILAHAEPVIQEYSTELLAGVYTPYSILPTCYVASLIREDDAGVRRVAPILRQMAQVVVVGNIADDPTAWNALCA